MLIGMNTIVAIRYIMRNGRGEVLENILEGSPAAYLHGSGTIRPELEVQLTGLATGERKQVIVSGAEGFEGMDDRFSFDVVIDSVRAATEKEVFMGRPEEEVQMEDCSPGCIC
jgi:FKBP-type peptidyl-prolyl cis-trans isomerase 2